MFRRAASAAVNLVGYELQGRYDPVTLRWLGPVGPNDSSGVQESGGDGGVSGSGNRGGPGGSNEDAASPPRALLDAKGKFVIGLEARMVRLTFAMCDATLCLLYLS